MIDRYGDEVWSFSFKRLVAGRSVTALYVEGRRCLKEVRHVLGDFSYAYLNTYQKITVGVLTPHPRYLPSR